MCGIMAWAGKSPKKFDKAKFNLLGSYNEDRGIHSCGVSVDGDIFIGIEKNKVFRDFIVNVGYENPEKIPVVIGHTRHATGGAHNEYNAHPFGFGKLNDTFEFIGVHNGSLLNHEEIATENNIELFTDLPGTKNHKRSRKKIDSELLLEIIYRNKNFKILSQYNGAAALVFQDLNKPNVLYCWHGASKKYSYEKGDKIFEERPLFYYKETRNSLYISSMKNSLESIAHDKDAIDEFEHNTLYTITDGNIEKARKQKISRKNCHHLKSNNYHNNSNKKRVYDDYEDDEAFYKHQGCNLLPRNTQTAIPFANDSISTGNAETSDKENIYNEPKPAVNLSNKTYFWKFRYFTGKDQLLSGCYVYIKDFGFFFLSDEVKKAETNFWQIVNKEFHTDSFNFKDFHISKNPKIPFIHNTKNEIINPPLHFFYKGVKLLSSMDYIQCMEAKRNNREFDWESLSHCSTHPIIDLKYQRKTSLTQCIKLKDKLFTGTICPLGSKYIYKILSGNCVSRDIKHVYFDADTKKNSNDKKVDSVKDIMSLLEYNEKDIEENERNEKSSLKDNRDKEGIVEKTIDSVLKPYLQKISLDMTRLEYYKNNGKVRTCMMVLENLSRDIVELVELEHKEL